ncbi:MAG: nucleoside kinase [Clostridiales Family XIII bacterium]|jgi:uridine kinase|nr:nucleoside kinase [Clostridiales Family XIII bacterium]
MDIAITLYVEPGAAPIERTVSAGITIEELLGEYRSHLPHRIITARVFSSDVALTYVIDKPCTITLCDIRDNTANRTFQRTLSLVYLKAVRETLGDVPVIIHNSVNRGIFTAIETDGAGEPLTAALLGRIEKRMWEIVDANLPISVDTVGKNALFQYLEKIGAAEKRELLQSAPDVHFVNVCHLDGYTNYFYGLMAPSSGYVDCFALDVYYDGVLLRFPHPSDPVRIIPYGKDDKIFAAYEEERKILNAFDLAYVSDLNRSMERGDGQRIVQMSEDLHAAKIEDLAERVASSGKRIVLIAGPSSSGKTTFSKRFIDALSRFEKKALYLGTDDYFVERDQAPKDEKGEYNFEGLDAVDVALFTRDINELLAGAEVDLPRFDFIEGKKVFGERKTRLGVNEIVVIEGIHALNRKMSKGVDDGEKFKIYISPLTQLNIDDHNRIPSTDVRLIRRMLRDYRTRGYSLQKTISVWPKVRAAESVNIFPFNVEADAVFNSSLVYELSVLRKYIEPLLEEIGPEEAEYGYAKWLLYFLRFFTPMEDESGIPPESVLREFIGGSRY